MKTDNLDISVEDSVIQVENWPQAENSNGANTHFNSEVDNVTVLPVCKDGVCQLGAWKPRKSA
jgi:hypothetical protein